MSEEIIQEVVPEHEVERKPLLGPNRHPLLLFGSLAKTAQQVQEAEVAYEQAESEFIEARGKLADARWKLDCAIEQFAHHETEWAEIRERIVSEPMVRIYRLSANQYEMTLGPYRRDLWEPQEPW